MARDARPPLTDAQLDVLIAVAEHASFTHAARRLGMTQSAVSHAVTALESSLGVELLVRSARGVRLTEVGERMVEHAREVMRLKALMRHDAEAMRTLRGGAVTVGSFGPTSSRHLLPPIMRDFERAYPDIVVRVQEGSDQEIEAWLDEERIDIGFVTLPSERFETTFLAEDELLAIVAADHPLAAADRIRPDALRATPFIMSTGGCEPAVREILDEGGLDVRYRIREVHSIVAMVAQRAGFAIKPTLSLPDPLPAGVVTRPLEPCRARRIGLAVRSRKALAPAARAFLKVAAATARSAPLGTASPPAADARARK